MLITSYILTAIAGFLWGMGIFIVESEETSLYLQGLAGLILLLVMYLLDK